MKKFNTKILIIGMAFIIVVSTVIVCFMQPKLHKLFQVNVIEYLIKINSDGSVSTTKSITTTELKEK